VASVGLTEAEARERLGSRSVRVATLPMERVDRARLAGHADGFVKLVTARRRGLGWTGGGRLVGAQIVGRSAGELIHECALAIRVDAFAGRLAQTIHAYPTSSLAVQQAASRLFPLGRALVEDDAAPLEPPSAG
jgi:pyruvate/2-oxoglutarate dehydrogenase complex dihydrolipoamide dehydrogenase (E3) component